MSRVVQILKRKVLDYLKLSFLVKERLNMYNASKDYKNKHPKGTIKFIEKYNGFNLEQLSNENIILFVVYSPKSFLMYERYFELLEKLDYKIVIISNGKLPDEFIAKFHHRVLFMAERHNIGRDFGTYKEFICLLREKKVELNNLIICNDSIFANLKSSDNRFIQFMKNNADKDFVGVAEYFGQPGYHLQSYFLKFSNKVLKGKNFNIFWDNFTIGDDRRLNIHNGEIKLSESILKDGIKPTVFLGIENLIDAIVNDKALLQKFIIEISGNKHIDPAITQSFKNLCLNYYNKGVEDEHIAYYQATLRLEISRLIERFGIIVVCPFFIIDAFGFPFLKRDLVYRQITDFALIKHYGKEYDQDLLEEFITDQRIRVRSWNIKGIKGKLMYHTGMN